MSATRCAGAPPAWRVIALLPQSDPDAVDTAAFAAALAAQPVGQAAGSLHFLHLRGTQDAPPVAPLLPAHATWWDARFDDASAAATGDAPGPDAWLALCHEALIAAMAGDGGSSGALATLVVLPATSLGDELAARLAVHMGHGSGAKEPEDGAANGAALLGRCQHFAPAPQGLCVRRAAYGGKVSLELQTSSRLVFATLQPNDQGQDPTGLEAPASDGAPRMRELALASPDPGPATERVDYGDGLPALDGAWLIVSGGRGIGGEEGFGLLRQIATQLGGTVGGSLPTVDAGWIPVSRQVGQSGKFVRPKVYFAVGVSGTPQHMAGVSRDAMLVALNSDPEAPIFQLADVGVVGDFRDVLPALLARLQAI